MPATKPNKETWKTLRKNYKKKPTGIVDTISETSFERRCGRC